MILICNFRGYLAEIDQPGVGPMILEGPAFYGSSMSRPVITPLPAGRAHQAHCPATPRAVG